VAPPGGFNETDPPAPRSHYATTKRATEEHVLSSLSSGTILRLALVYGRRVGDREGFLGWIREGLVKRRPVSLFSDEWRTPVFADDIPRAITTLLHANIPAGAPSVRIFHLGGPERISRFEFGMRYATALGYDHTLLRKVNIAEMPAIPPRAPDV